MAEIFEEIMTYSFSDPINGINSHTQKAKQILYRKKKREGRMQEGGREGRREGQKEGKKKGRKGERDRGREAGRKE